MLKCDQPERPKKTYTIPKVSKKRQEAIANGTFVPKQKKPIKVNPNYKIPARSKRRAKQEREYLTITRPELIKKHPICQAKIKCKGALSTECHHVEGRIEELLNDKSKILCLCHECHQWAELNPNEAKALGISSDRL
jgi:hypothetical protein